MPDRNSRNGNMCSSVQRCEYSNCYCRKTSTRLWRSACVLMPLTAAVGSRRRPARQCIQVIPESGLPSARWLPRRSQVAYLTVTRSAAECRAKLARPMPLLRLATDRLFLGGHNCIGKVWRRPSEQRNHWFAAEIHVEERSDIFTNRRDGFVRAHFA
jgi:hypothetical protein